MSKSGWTATLFRWFFTGGLRPPRRVLVVEDDLLQRPILARILYSFNERMDLSWVTSYHAAKRALARESFDLVIADVVLEGKGRGTDLHYYCSKWYPDLPVVVTSCLPLEVVEKEAGVPAGEMAFLPKPILPRTTREKIQGVIERRWFAKIGSLLV